MAKQTKEQAFMSRIDIIFDRFSYWDALEIVRYMGKFMGQVECRAFRNLLDNGKLTPVLRIGFEEIADEFNPEGTVLDTAKDDAKVANGIDKTQEPSFDSPQEAMQYIENNTQETAGIPDEMQGAVDEEEDDEEYLEIELSDEMKEKEKYYREQWVIPDDEEFDEFLHKEGHYEKILKEKQTPPINQFVPWTSIGYLTERVIQPADEIRDTINNVVEVEELRDQPIIEMKELIEEIMQQYYDKPFKEWRFPTRVDKKLKTVDSFWAELDIGMHLATIYTALYIHDYIWATDAIQEMLNLIGQEEQIKAFTRPVDEEIARMCNFNPKLQKDCEQILAKIDAKADEANAIMLLM